MISFALMELQCPSLDYVYDMTWAEFQIRSYGYARMQEREDLRAREIAWSALIGSHYNPKKLPKSKDKFWKIGKEDTSGKKEMFSVLRKEQQEYLKRKKNG